MKLSARLAFFAITATLAYLAMAIWAIGGFVAFFAHGSLVVVALATLVMAVAALFTEASLSSGEREDRGNRWVVAALGILGLLSGFLPAYTDRIGFLTSVAKACAGSARCCTPSAARCACGRCSCWAIASAGWWQSSRDIG
jgi:hypothetical protein